MRHYFRLFTEFVRINLVRDMEFRGNFLLQFIIECFWVSILLVTINMYFSFTDEVLGWTRFQVLFLLGLFRFIKGVFDFAFYNNLFYLSDTINKGEMDYLLTKPVNSLFISSLHTLNFTEIGEAFVGLIICVYSLISLQFHAPWYLWVGFLVSVIMGIIVYYCLVLLFSTLAFFTSRLTALSAYQDIVKQLLRYPTDILHTNNYLLSLVVFILALVATFPAKILLSKSPLYTLGFQMVGLTILFMISLRFWNFALRRYSSASS